MMPTVRRQQLIDILREHGALEIPELSAHFGVSEMTIRRDLERLERDGRLYRVRGGALIRESTVHERPVTGREQAQVDEKRAIARQAVTHIQPDESIAFDASTTGLAVTRVIDRSASLTIVTNNLKIAGELSHHSGISLFILGGLIRSEAMSVIGSQAETAMRGFHVDKVFLSGKALSATGGLSDINALEVGMKRTMVERAREVFVLADHTKLGHKAFLNVIPPAEITTVITDHKADPEQVHLLEEAGLVVEIAPAATHIAPAAWTGPRDRIAP